LEDKISKKNIGAIFKKKTGTPSGKKVNVIPEEAIDVISEVDIIIE
ncbi:7372_t:CDS:1, partial [Racocetra persica]